MINRILFLIAFFCLSYQINATQNLKTVIVQDSCVDINFKNGKTIVAKIIKSNGQEIFYQKCNTDDKKIYQISTEYVTSIVKLDAKSQRQAYGIGNKFNKTTNAIVWAGLSAFLGILILAAGSGLFLLMLLITLIASILGLFRLRKNRDYPYRIWAFIFLSFTLLITILLGVLPFAYVLLFLL
jgi:asparagine N-glycosylation enzyme membrane subunit Stt3